jgi:hypothetical protein
VTEERNTAALEATLEDLRDSCVGFLAYLLCTLFLMGTFMINIEHWLALVIIVPIVFTIHKAGDFLCDIICNVTRMHIDVSSITK